MRARIVRALSIAGPDEAIAKAHELQELRALGRGWLGWRGMRRFDRALAEYESCAREQTDDSSPKGWHDPRYRDPEAVAVRLRALLDALPPP
jgi:hypothetical protein